jgi:release factor glutamine methyltransferase
MTDNQAFKFLSKFAPPREVQIILKNTHRRGFLYMIGVAWKMRCNVPIAKITGKKWFYGMEFHTNKHTLDPRPDSETLVDAVLTNERGARKILDMGTGTGCLACAIVKNIPKATGVGIDISRRACRVARKNAKDLGLENRIKIIRGTFSKCDARGFDVIVSNPPYIPVGDSRVNAGAKRDPKIALYGGADGLTYYREIARLETNTKLYLEIGAGQERAVKKIFAGAGWTVISKHKDLSGRIRVLSFKR